MTTARQAVQDLLTFIDASPSPWHAVAQIEQRLQAFDFLRLEEHQPWQLTGSGRYYVIRDDSSIVIFVVGSQPCAEHGMRLIGAHTDSPGLRIKPNPVLYGDQLVRLAVEIYGGPILATFTDRDLSIAGRVIYRNDSGKLATRLIDFPRALLRLPNLAIHMNRSVNEEGLKLHKQQELALLIADSLGASREQDYLPSLLASACELDLDQLLSWELNVYDTQQGGFWGQAQNFYAHRQLDNLASCHAGLTALLDEATLNSGNTMVCTFFDHEEIGSESLKGAAGSFLPDVLERIAASLNMTAEDYKRMLANSAMLSADMAHAYQPNFPAAYEPGHKILVNQGPVIKINANHRYASTCHSEARFIDLCKRIDVPYQKYSHRGDLPCGSTIGPIASARLGISTVDVGSPMWAMHSARESAGVLDHGYMIKVMQGFLSEQ